MIRLKDRAVAQSVAPGVAVIKGVEYQQGALAGYEVREYLLAKWQRRGTYCGKTRVPLNVDHVRPRSHGGSNRVSNLPLACVPCNQAKGSQLVEAFLTDRPAVLANLLKERKTPWRDAAAVSATRSQLWPRTKVVRGFTTGDLVRAVVPSGEKAGTHVGRVAVRASGRFNIHTSTALVQGVHHRHIRLLQRGDGWAYTVKSEDMMHTSTVQTTPGPVRALKDRVSALDGR